MSSSRSSGVGGAPKHVDLGHVEGEKLKTDLSTGDGQDAATLQAAAAARHGGATQRSTWSGSDFGVVGDQALAGLSPMAREVTSFLQENGIQFRIGGSTAARLQFGAPRNPNDLDLEFWTYAEAEKASKLLEAHKPKTSDGYPRLEYFVVTEKEQGVSNTVVGMGPAKANARRPGPVMTYEFNNENTQHGSRDYKNAPNTRHPVQPPFMRRQSIVAGNLERLSYTLYFKEKDTKGDMAQLKHLIASMSTQERASLLEEVRSMFDWNRIRQASEEFRASASSGSARSQVVGNSDSEEEDPPIDHQVRMTGAMSVLEQLIKAHQGS